MNTEMNQPSVAEQRVWIFCLESDIPPVAQRELERELQSFVDSWKAHGSKVSGAAEVVHSRFVVLRADPAVTQVSGCSIDSMFKAVAKAAQRVGSDIASLDQIFFREENVIRSVSREEFREMARNGEVSGDTRVFDNTLQKLSEFQERWEVPARESWHSRLLGVD